MASNCNSSKMMHISDRLILVKLIRMWYWYRLMKVFKYFENIIDYNIHLSLLEKSFTEILSLQQCVKFDDREFHIYFLLLSWILICSIIISVGTFDINKDLNSIGIFVLFSGILVYSSWISWINLRCSLVYFVIYITKSKAFSNKPISKLEEHSVFFGQWTQIS